jgi:polyhydroxyalkanoate synthase subunit PhaC
MERLTSSPPTQPEADGKKRKSRARKSRGAGTEPRASGPGATRPQPHAKPSPADAISSRADARPPRSDEQTTTAKATDAPVIDIESLSKNIARMIEEGGKALAAYLKPREQGRIGADGRAEDIADVVRTLGHVLEYWLADPKRAVELQTGLGKTFLELWEVSVKRMVGEEAAPVVSPDPRDKRFSDPEWSSNQYFDFLKQAYLLTVKWANELVKNTKGLDPLTQQKAEFYVRQIGNAIAPSNFILTNPELLRETLASNADNLVRGMHNLAEDIAAGGGDLRIKQSDPSKFEVGRNLALTPGKVIFQNDLMQLIQYAPATEMVLKRPLLIVPPWINKFYILDLNPEKSFIKWCVDQGHTVFCISWVNPDAHLARKSFTDYMCDGPLKALDVIEEVSGKTQVNAIGYCVGGTLLAVTLAYMAEKQDHRIASATFFAAQVDFAYSGDLKVFAADEQQIEQVEREMAERGYLEGKKMANAFNLMRSNDLIWPYVINNYLRGKSPFPFDLLYWNSDATRMPAANHSFYLRNCYFENKLTKGEMEVAGVRLDLKKVTVPVYNLATREDHIAPAKSVYVGSSFFGGPVKYVLAGSGHIAGVINPPKFNKYQFWTGPKPKGANVDAWIAKATEHPGSWWSDWIEWIKSQDATVVEARTPGGGKLKPIEDAPGSYVKVRD